MRIREARMRDAEEILSLMGKSEVSELDKISERIRQDAGSIRIATDFSAHILGCALSKEEIYVNSAFPEQGVAEELAKQFS